MLDTLKSIRNISGFGTIRYYSRVNPSSQVGAISVPPLRVGTEEQGLQVVQELCTQLNSQLPHLYHYFEPK